MYGWRQLLGLTATGAARCVWLETAAWADSNWSSRCVWLEIAAWADSNWSSRCVVGDSCLG